jgi:hypothetical protein
MDLKYKLRTTTTKNEKQNKKNLLKAIKQKKEKHFSVTNKLKKLFELNKSDLKKKNDNLIKIIADPQFIKSAYAKIRKNKSEVILGCYNEAVHRINLKQISQISEKLKKGCYHWGNIRIKEIERPEKKK